MDPPPVNTSLMRYTVFVVGTVAVLAFTCSFIYVCWWSACRRQTALHADSKANCPGIHHSSSYQTKLSLLFAFCVKRALTFLKYFVIFVIFMFICQHDGDKQYRIKQKGRKCTSNSDESRESLVHCTLLPLNDYSNNTCCQS